MVKLASDSQINLEKLIATRMLINANSGGGKSWAIRRLLEQSQGKVQQIVIDLEGEFSTLREKYDYLLVGKEGEIPVSIRTAELLAKRLLELNVSTIIDLSELKRAERMTFVKRFLDSLLDLPKSLWHPALILIDEAHHFAPEKEKSESASSVIDLMTRGRKRGFAGILATQRISKLNKDAIAEANNCMIGRATLDIDQKRAGDILGFTSKEDVRNLRDVKSGEFFIFGPAFDHNGIKKIKVGNVKTTHPDRTRGVDIVQPAKTPDKIKKLLKDFSDLPKEAEEELKTKDEMKSKIRELKTKLIIAEKSQKVKTDEKAVERAKVEGYNLCKKDMIREINFLRKENNALINLQKKIGQLLEVTPVPRPKYEIKESNFKPTPLSKAKPFESKTETLMSMQTMSSNSNDKIAGGASRMLKAIAMYHPDSVTKSKVATMAGLSYRGGSFRTYISTLKRNNLILVNGNQFKATETGLQEVGDIEPVPSDPESLVQMWCDIIKGGASRMLRTLADNYPQSLSKETLGAEVGVDSSSGSFRTYLSILKRNGLIEVNGQEVKISEELFQ